ncbi:hypothetical protein [Gemmatimonas phototrophica]|uniref:hypothetical protein n=1 Tax=Gemmatimonas phototrophica TaxID=1379270 RepID=UPI00047E6788|nr:hypothetical protein [Gemmatimonas phototrophica]
MLAFGSRSRFASLSMITAATFALAACGAESPTGVDESASATAGRSGSSGTLGGTTGSTTGSTAGGATGTATTTTTAARCNGTLAAITVDDVFVPIGATCALAGTTVRGNVKVSFDGSVVATGARIAGSVQAEDGRSVTLTANTAVTGDVEVKRRAAARVENSTIGGNVLIEETGASLTAFDSRILGNVQVSKAERADVARVTVEGDVQFSENIGALRSDAAIVRGNMQIEKNRGGVTLTGNRVSQTLECKENVPAPTGAGNVANEKKEQCRAL